MNKKKTSRRFFIFHPCFYDIFNMNSLCNHVWFLSPVCTRITHGSLSSPTPPLTPTWQRRCLRNNHEKLIHVMAIFLNESRPNWEPHYSRTSEPIRSVRGEESGGYVFHMVRESAICYDSQVEECMHSENSHLLSCHFVFYSTTMSSRPAHIIFKVLPFQGGQTQIFILLYAIAFTLSSTLQNSGMSYCWWILLPYWYLYSIIQFSWKKIAICVFQFPFLSLYWWSYIKMNVPYSAEMKWLTADLTYNQNRKVSL